MARHRPLAALVVFCGVLSLGAAQAPKPKPEPARPSRPAPPTPAPKATLVIETDLPCLLTIDGDDRGRLDAGQTTKTSLDPGEHIVRCASTENAEVVWRKTIDVSGSQTRAAAVELKPLIEAKKQQRAQEQAAAAAKDQAAQAAAWIGKLEGRWSDLVKGNNGNGPYTDEMTLLLAQQGVNVISGTLSCFSAQTYPDGQSETGTIVAEVSISVQGPEPIATISRSQILVNDTLKKDVAPVLRNFQYVTGLQPTIDVSVEFGSWECLNHQLHR